MMSLAMMELVGESWDSDGNEEKQKKIVFWKMIFYEFSQKKISKRVIVGYREILV